ncbi:hypothetical protein LTR85_003683 [Meristemomyces frigidus]|nr:hypothetical protein LTR85_003683 [Meristemomyces frigidus]
MPYPDHLDKHPKIIFFSDFDGTITQDDCIDWLVETEGYGPEKLKKSCDDILNGEISSREGSKEQMESIRTPFEKCVKKALDHVKLDEHFVSFHNWATSVSMPIVILSGGLTPLIRATLSELLGGGANSIEVVANEVVPRVSGRSVNEDGGWAVQLRDDSAHGNDKAAAIRPYAQHRDRMPDDQKPVLLYAGDGVSDLGAARETELLFAKEGQDLVTYCKKEVIPFTTFQSWKTISEVTQDIFYGRKTLEQVVEAGRQIADAKAL